MYQNTFAFIILFFTCSIMLGLAWVMDSETVASKPALLVCENDYECAMMCEAWDTGCDGGIESYDSYVTRRNAWLLSYREDIANDQLAINNDDARGN